MALSIWVLRAAGPLATRETPGGVAVLAANESDAVRHFAALIAAAGIGSEADAYQILCGRACAEKVSDLE